MMDAGKQVGHVHQGAVLVADVRDHHRIGVAVHGEHIKAGKSSFT